MSSMGGGPSGVGGGAFDDYGGVDPSMDPELAMAIRASTEEARAQEEARVSTRIDFCFSIEVEFKNLFDLQTKISY